MLPPEAHQRRFNTPRTTESPGRTGSIRRRREAVKKANHTDYDIIFMDCQMPEMDGFEPTAAIRKLPGRDGAPIIALMINALQGDRERCLQAGMDDYISKPLKPSDL